MNIFTWLWLRWHGYCPKHLTKRSYSGDPPNVGSYCSECLNAGYLRSQARRAQADAKAAEIIKGLKGAA